MKQIILSAVVLLAILPLLNAQNFALQFTGGDEHLEVPADPNFDIGSGYTIEAWIQASAWRSQSWQGSIVGRDGQGPDSGFSLRCGKNGTLSFVVQAATGWTEVQSGEVMNASQWYHVAATVDGSSIAIYVNGEAIASEAYTAPVRNNSRPIHIGGSPGFGGRGFDGAIDEVRIWNVARTALEINTTKDEALSGTEAGLVAYLPMNEGTGGVTRNLANAVDANLVMLDESAWVDGYAIPAVDVGITEVLSPDVMSVYARPVRPTVRIANLGAEAVSNVPIQVSLGGTVVGSETFPGTISPGESAVFTFSTIFDVEDEAQVDLTFKTAATDDANSLNNALSIAYRRPEGGNVVTVLRNEQHNFGSRGQTQFANMILPNDPEAFEQILLRIWVDCPSTGCDPWDQPAKLAVVKDGVEYELGRYVTPYGKGCGPWTIDVTNFKSILTGAVSFKSYVQVWGGSGWLVNAELEYVRGSADFAYQRLTPLYGSDYIVYGDPNVSHDLPVQQVQVANHTKQSQVRVTLSGHGQGNTNNAAEFMLRNHELIVGDEQFDHRLWKADCGVNPCANQAGTWTLSRAGWCPGQQVTPFVVDATDLAPPGEAVAIDYVFQDYRNLRNTGYNGGSHTEPHYKLWSYFVEMSDQRFEAYTNVKATSVNIVASGTPSSPLFESVEATVQNTGSTTVSSAQLRYYVNGVLQGAEPLAQDLLSGDTYRHTFSNPTGFVAGDRNVVFVEIVVPGDENINDDLVRGIINEQLLDSQEPAAFGLTVSPNPSPSGRFEVQLAELPSDLSASLFDMQGRLLSTQAVRTSTFEVQVPTAGVFVLLLRDTNGNRVYRQLMR